MPDCKIEYKNEIGFWIEEVFMQLVYNYIYEEIIKPQYSIPNKDLLLYEMRFHIDGYSYGSMSLGWGRFLQNNSETETMINVLKNVKILLGSKGESISVNELQNITTEDENFKYFYSKKPFPTSELIKVIDALIQMLNEIWTSTNYSMKIDYTL